MGIPQQPEVVFVSYCIYPLSSFMSALMMICAKTLTMTREVKAAHSSIYQSSGDHVSWQACLHAHTA